MILRPPAGYPQNFHHGRVAIAADVASYIIAGGEATRFSACAPAFSALLIA